MADDPSDEEQAEENGPQREPDGPGGGVGVQSDKPHDERRQGYGQQSFLKLGHGINRSVVSG